MIHYSQNSHLTSPVSATTVVYFFSCSRDDAILLLSGTLQDKYTDNSDSLYNLRERNALEHTQSLPLQQTQYAGQGAARRGEEVR